jgi:hypothetical protein
MLPNIAESGIAYGYVAAQELDSDVVSDLMYGSQAKNISEAEYWQERQDLAKAAYEDAMESFLKVCQDLGQAAPIFSDFDPDFLPDEGSQIEEPTVEGVLDGVHYRSSWLGGALHFFILQSPYVALQAGAASPCVPNAGILHAENNGNVRAYTIPTDWWAEEN